ncbi:MAG: aminotransferase class III-fold pyridoxal phosphate-dependent enzyme, partial [Betaproteobacteria bacterium]|nr:aminotransferase class III-fold pyridoxal phosphate-dependent enzyme [Betaproteobacteria bacterium]
MGRCCASARCDVNLPCFSSRSVVLLGHQLPSSVRYRRNHAIEFLHGYTYSGHPVACAAAVATLGLMAQERLFQRAAQMGPVLGRAMHHALKG